MRALKIATKAQRPEIRSRCQSLLNEAERIKQMPEDWVKMKQEPDFSESFASIDLQPVRLKDSDFKTKFMSTPSTTHPTLNFTTPSLTPEPPKPKPKPTVRLREPVSTRILPITEKILLLNAAKLNGLKFPPWPGPPKPEEFEIRDGEEPFE
jgi:hypothetical protein